MVLGKYGKSVSVINTCSVAVCKAASSVDDFLLESAVYSLQKLLMN